VRGDRILPVEKHLFVKNFHTARNDKVYVTTNIIVARLFARRFGEDGIIYRVDPVGDLIPDPEFRKEECFMCDSAWVRYIRETPR